MYTKITDFVKEHKRKIIGGMIFVGGVAIGYCVGYKYLVKCYDESNVMFLKSNDKEYLSRMINFFNSKEKGTTFAYIFEINTPKDKVTEIVESAIEKLPEQYETVNVYMEGLKK